jgi:hypothetical protein
MSPHEPRYPASGISLKTCVEELRRRCETIASIQGGFTYYHEELEIFRAYAEEKQLFFQSEPLELIRPPDDEGNEHQVWFSPSSSIYLKATWPSFFGMLVIHRNNEEPKASPIDYLERWQLHNELFGDSVEFLGIIRSNGAMRLMIKQPAIIGTPASMEQIDTFFRSHGWQPFKVSNNQAYFDPQRNVVISDTHRGNIILMDDGLLAPIDLRVQLLSSSLVDTVKKLCSR